STSPLMISNVANNACHMPCLPSPPTSMYEALSHHNHNNQSGKNADCSNNQADTANENHLSEKSQSSRSGSASLIDLTPDRAKEDSPVDCTKQSSSFAKSDMGLTNEPGNSLKRKGPLEENCELFKPTPIVAPSTENSNT